MTRLFVDVHRTHGKEAITFQEIFYINFNTYRKIQLNTKDMLKDKFFIIIRISCVCDINLI